MLFSDVFRSVTFHYMKLLPNIIYFYVDECRMISMDQLALINTTEILCDRYSDPIDWIIASFICTDISEI